jgi:pyruvate dehydrogenase E2 component (dihydrolipoamide acetyltransferase)
MNNVEMPKMGDTMETGKILNWIKKVGDVVKKGEPLAEVETDKVNIEIESFYNGTLRKILVPEGESAPIGAPIALIGSPDEPLPEDAKGKSDGTPAREAARPSNGATKAAAPVQTSTAAPAPAPTARAAPAPAQVSTATVERAPTERIFISPLARRLATEHQLDYSHIQGTGPNGRIIKLDVEAALARQPQVAPVAPAAQPMPAPEPEAVPAAVEAGEVVEIPLTAMRRTIARRLSQSMQTAPHFYMTSVIDTGKLAALRQQINEYAAHEPEPVKVSFNDLIIKAVARALVLVPQVNVSFAEDRILQKKQVHVGMAVALEQGLIVPVIRNADRRGILDIAREAKRLAEAARTGKLRPEEFSGGTFTVSNLGMFDVDSFTGVINPPESAILAVGSITPTPVVEDGQVVVRDRMKVTMSSDHRAVDGATAARFLQQVKRLLEEPLGLLV